jgi:hypothetical protein
VRSIRVTVGAFAEVAVPVPLLGAAKGHMW